MINKRKEVEAARGMSMCNRIRVYVYEEAWISWFCGYGRGVGVGMMGGSDQVVPVSEKKVLKPWSGSWALRSSVR